MNIHFASVFGCDYDMDLCLQWSKHYSKYGFDSYTIFVNGNDEAVSYCNEVFRKQGFKTKLIFFTPCKPDENPCLTLRVKYLRDYSLTLPQEDSLVTADSDEFQHIPLFYKDLIKYCGIVRGELVDRYDTTAHYANETTELEKQYPLEGKLHRMIYDASPQSVQLRAHRPILNKICACSLKYKVSFEGSHGFEGDLLKLEDNWKGPDIFKVYHYSWRTNFIERMCLKDYYTADYINMFAKFFKIEVTPRPLWDKLEKEMEVQKSKGWV